MYESGMITSVKKAFLLLVFVFFACLYGHTTLAATHTVSPLILDYTSEPRDILHQDVTITNTTGAKLQLFPTFNNVTVGTEGGVVVFLPASMSDRTSSLTSWMDFSHAPLELNAGEERKLPLTITVNPNAQSGVYHALLSFPTGGNRDEAERSVMAGGVPGVMVNLSIDDKKVEVVTLSKFHVKTFVVKPEADNALILIKNTGDTDIIPKGDIIIYNKRGNEVASLPVNPSGETVRAGQETTFTSSVPMEGLMGKYKAHLSLTYGTEHINTLQDTVYFYILPWKKLLMLFLGLVFVTVVVVLLLSYRARKYDDDYDDEEFDSDLLPLTLRDSVSESKSHDIDMKRNS